MEGQLSISKSKDKFANFIFLVSPQADFETSATLEVSSETSVGEEVEKEGL